VGSKSHIFSTCSWGVAALLSSILLRDILPISFRVSHQFPNHSAIDISIEVIVVPLMSNNLWNPMKIVIALENLGIFSFASPGPAPEAPII
jgi:hypothetical protein